MEDEEGGLDIVGVTSLDILRRKRRKRRRERGHRGDRQQELRNLDACRQLELAVLGGECFRIGVVLCHRLPTADATIVHRSVISHLASRNAGDHLF